MKRFILTIILLIFMLAPSARAQQASSPAPASSAFENTLKSAQAGDAEAQYHLGDLYRSGLGVDKDMTEAVKWYRAAALQNYADAQYTLGEMYHEGKDVGRSYPEAFKWYREAAANGSGKAKDVLYQYYFVIFVFLFSVGALVISIARKIYLFHRATRAAATARAVDTRTNTRTDTDTDADTAPLPAGEYTGWLIRSRGLFFHLSGRPLYGLSFDGVNDRWKVTRYRSLSTMPGAVDTAWFPSIPRALNALANQPRVRADPEAALRLRGGFPFESIDEVKRLSETFVPGQDRWRGPETAREAADAGAGEWETDGRNITFRYDGAILCTLPFDAARRHRTVHWFSPVTESLYLQGADYPAALSPALLAGNIRMDLFNVLVDKGESDEQAFIGAIREFPLEFMAVESIGVMPADSDDAAVAEAATSVEPPAPPQPGRPAPEPAAPARAAQFTPSRTSSSFTGWDEEGPALRYWLSGIPVFLLVYDVSGERWLTATRPPGATGGPPTISGFRDYRDALSVGSAALSGYGRGTAGMTAGFPFQRIDPLLALAHHFEPFNTVSLRFEARAHSREAPGLLDATLPSNRRYAGNDAHHGAGAAPTEPDGGLFAAIVEGAQEGLATIGCLLMTIGVLFIGVVLFGIISFVTNPPCLNC